MTEQELPFKVKCQHVNFDDMLWMLSKLSDGKWHTATELGGPQESSRRRLRACADASGGRIAGGQKGYKLVERMESGEYQHSRNFLLSQAKEMQRRVLEMDKVFFGRKAVPK